MVAYNFKSRFVSAIESKAKQQTIRAIGKKRHARPGELVQLYTGDRFHPKRIGIARCQIASPITLNFRVPSVTWENLAGDGFQTTIGDAGLDAFAISDGFSSWPELEAFWIETHDIDQAWSGIRISWGDSFVPDQKIGEST